MSYFGRLRLPGLGCDIELVWYQLYNEPTSAAVPPQLLEFLLETRWLFDPCARRELMTLLLARDAMYAHVPRSLDGERELLRERIGALIRFGVIVGIELNPFDKLAVGTATQDMRTPPPPSKGKVEPDDALSFYEIQLVDELDTPLAGITIGMSTPAGSITKTTNAQGIARVENAPVGMGRASIESVDELQRRLERQEQKPRRVRPLPRGDDWHVRTLSKAIESISLPDGARQHLMIVTRTDVFGQAIRWGHLSLTDASGPWSLHAGGEALLKLHADATVVMLHPWQSGSGYGAATSASLPSLCEAAIRFLWTTQRICRNTGNVRLGRLGISGFSLGGGAMYPALAANIGRVDEVYAFDCLGAKNFGPIAAQRAASRPEARLRMAGSGLNVVYHQATYRTIQTTSGTTAPLPRVSALPESEQGYRKDMNPLWDHVLKDREDMRAHADTRHQFTIFGGYVALPGPFAKTFLSRFLEDSLFQVA
ncbi:hypothetical protein WMF45_41355 [Sorangium sp. So ce448]|uniref:hypothetical protein n=1 Tax=Sorangium sp. So ce448 TaxID=3133314 RepID=UPI003F5E105C